MLKKDFKKNYGIQESSRSCLVVRCTEETAEGKDGVEIRVSGGEINININNGRREKRFRGSVPIGKVGIILAGQLAS